MRGYKTVGHTQTHGDSKAGGSYEDTFMCVPELVDIHAEVDPTVHLGHMMMRDSSQENAEVYIGIQGDALDCREETHLVEH
jgi:hypothetical protein